MAADIHVIVCSYAGDDPALVLRTLEAAAAQGPVVLVDMSPDAGLAEPAAAIANVSVRHVPESTGLGESRQIGLHVTDARYVAFLDSDAVPRSGWLSALREAVDPADVGVAGGPVVPVWPEGRVPTLFRTQTAGDFLSMLDLGPEPLDTPRVLPGNMVVDRQATGEHVFASERGRRPGTLAGAEEIAMMLRLVAAGARIVYEPRAAVDHRTKRERMNWRWMWRRLEAAGRDSVLDGQRLEPLPRQLRTRDRLFLAAAAPPYLAGRMRARAQAVRSRRAVRSAR
jgi:glycosyltransferase involved in cell wall biosynthesis